MQGAQAIACATCSLDPAEGGQILLLVTMLATPILALLLAVIVVRRLLHKLGERNES